MIQIVKKLSKYIKEYKKETILTPIFVVLEVIMEVIIPLLMAKIIDVGIQNGDVGYILEMGVLLIIAAILSLTFAKGLKLTHKSVSTPGKNSVYQVSELYPPIS